MPSFFLACFQNDRCMAGRTAELAGRFVQFGGGHRLFGEGNEPAIVHCCGQDKITTFSHLFFGKSVRGRSKIWGAGKTCLHFCTIQTGSMRLVGNRTYVSFDGLAGLSFRITEKNITIIGQQKPPVKWGYSSHFARQVTAGSRSEWFLRHFSRSVLFRILSIHSG